MGKIYVELTLGLALKSTGSTMLQTVTKWPSRTFPWMEYVAEQRAFFPLFNSSSNHDKTIDKATYWTQRNAMNTLFVPIWNGTFPPELSQYPFYIVFGKDRPNNPGAWRIESWTLAFSCTGITWIFDRLHSKCPQIHLLSFQALYPDGTLQSRSTLSQRPSVG